MSMGGIVILIKSQITKLYMETDLTSSCLINSTIRDESTRSARLTTLSFIPKNVQFVIKISLLEGTIPMWNEGLKKDKWNFWQ